MRRLFGLIASLSVLAALPGFGAGQASAAPAAQAGPTGYSMVGAPTGSNFDRAEKLWAWVRVTQQYADITDTRTAVSSDAHDCPGYWAYFPTIVTVTFPAVSHTGDHHTCALSAGWNLVGNPFGSAASLPSSVIAYGWDARRGTYVPSAGIPVGGSVFIYEPVETTITLTAT